MCLCISFRNATVRICKSYQWKDDTQGKAKMFTNQWARQNIFISVVRTTNQIKKETLWLTPPLLPFSQLIWCWSEIHLCKYSQAINWTMNILSSKAHIPARVFSSLSHISEGKTFMKDIKECPCTAGTALFPYDWRSSDCLCKILAALLHAEKKKQSDSILFMSRTFESELGCTYTSLCNHCSGLIRR